ncbi:MAG TPA: cadherin domain-containing protein, partial [Allosphingosinicella sp.]
MSDPSDFPTRLRAAVDTAKQLLGSGFSLNANRAGAYIAIANVLRDEYGRTGNLQLFNAAIQLEEQAEITTYSGFNGSAAQLGNYNAMVRNRLGYNTPLDIFSFEIDTAVVNFFDQVVTRGTYSQITRENINAVDGLVWASKGLIEYFPGTALGIDYRNIAADSVVWSSWGTGTELYQQLRDRSFGNTSYAFQYGGIHVAQAMMSDVGRSIGRTPANFGFSDSQIAAYAGQPIVSSLGYRYEVDSYGRKIITNLSNNSIAFIDNNRDLASDWQSFLLSVTGVTNWADQAFLLNGFVETRLFSGSWGDDWIVEGGVHGLDRFREALGAGYDPSGPWYRNLQGSEFYQPGWYTNFGVGDLLSAFGTSYRPSATPSSWLSVDSNGNRSVNSFIVVNSPSGSVAYFQSRKLNENNQVISTSTSRIERASDGSATLTALTEQQQTAVLNAAEAERIATLLAARQNAVENGSDGGLASLRGENVEPTSLPSIEIQNVGSTTTLSLGTYRANDHLLPQVDPRTGADLPDRLRRVHSIFGAGLYAPDGTVVMDQRDRVVQLDVAEINGVATVVRSRASDGWFYNPDGSASRAGVTVETLYSGGHAVDTDIIINGNPIGIDFSDAGGILGQQLGSLLAKGDVLTGIVASSLLQTFGNNLGDVLDGLIGNQSINNATKDAFSTFGPELLSNLKGAGIGALSSFLTAELVKAVGVSGFAGELFSTASGSVISTVLNNIASGAANPFANIGSAASLGTAVASFLGNKLASEIVTFGSIGGQLGAAVGSALGVAALSSFIVIAEGAGIASATLFGAQLGAFAGPVAALVGAFVGTLVGGLIGSAFGGTPRSGADVEWDSGIGEFVVANVYARKNGSKEAAKSVATAVAETFNSILNVAGGELLNPHLVQAGNYGTRNTEYVYRPYSTTDKSQITQRFKGKDAPERLIAYGTFQALASGKFQIAGGDTYVKRALYNSLSDPTANASDFDSSILLGNIAVAQQYGVYQHNATSINALISGEPNSVFAAEWGITFTRAVELGLTRRHASDWYGGFGHLLEEGSASAETVRFGFDYDPFSDKVSRSIRLGGFYLGDEIDVAGQTTIEGTAAGEVIRLTHANTNVEGTAVVGGVDWLASAQGLKINRQDGGEGPISIDVAATIDAGGGDDVVHGGDMGNNLLGGAGNDTLYGGRLDDWLLGGDGADSIHAGDEAGNFAGDGNYLDGGAGNDTLYGGEGSDWLEGGDGDDVVEGRGGEDILTGGAGHDILRGGTGGDTYLIRAGDQNDEAEDVVTAQVIGVAPPAAGVPAPPDPVKARYAGIAAKTIAKNWGGDSFDIKLARLANEAAANAAQAAAVATGTGSGVLAAPVAIAPVEAAGEDSIVFGAGIELGDIRITRSGGVNGADLLIEVMKLNAAGTDQEPTGTELLVKDWFVNPFKRIEWLKLADGTEVRIGDFTSFVAGTAAGDVLIGTSGDDFVVAGAGDDQLHLLAGNDVGNGGTGNDLVAGDDGSDMLLGGLGDDKLIGGAGRDAATGDAGADDIYGGAADDILSGGRGNDLIVGGAGNDVFKYMRGDGRDTMFDEFSNNWVAVWSAGSGYAAGFARDSYTGEITGPGATPVYKNMGTADAPDYRWLGRFDYNFATGTLYRYDETTPLATSVINAGTDTIEFGIGIDIQDVILTRASATSPDLVLTISQEDDELGSYLASSDSITIKNWYNVPGQIEKLAFYQTGELIIGGTGAIKLVAGTDAANGTTGTPLAGSATADWITGGAGDDVIAGGGGDDILNGNSGFDTLKGEAGSDVVYGGAGNDTIDGGDASTTLFAADMLFGGAGVDTATYASVNAKVRAYLGAAWANAGAAAGDQFFDIENLTGSTWGASIPAMGTGDVLGGDAGDNEINGGRGDDTMLGGAGDDTYMWNGAEWGDVIREGAFTVEEAVNLQGKLVEGFKLRWSDTGTVWDSSTGATYMKLEVINAAGDSVYSWDQYAYGTASRPAVTNGFVTPDATQADTSGWDQRGWGSSGFARTNGLQVTREKFDTSADGGQDTIEFGAGLSLTDYIFIRSNENGAADDNGNSLMIRYQTSGVDFMLIKNHFTSSGAVEFLQFRDGLSVSLANLLVADTGATLTGTGSAEFLSALSSTSAEHLLGMGGNDVLSGLKGNDWLEGGDGDDTLEGGSGADQLEGGANSSPTTLNWGDTVRYAHSLSAVNVDLTRTTGQLGGDAAGDILTGIENVVGSWTGGDTISGDGGANRIDGLDGNNVIHGWAGDDVLLAGTGADFLYGDDGDDAISGADGIDTMDGGNGNDRLTGGAGNDKLRGEDGDDVLNAGEGDDSIVEGGLGQDHIFGEQGNDILTGGAGDDLIGGGTGNDTMDGAAGNDIFLVERGFGTDTIADTDGVNILQFADASFDQLWLTRSGSDLLVRVVGTTDSVKMLGFFSGGGRLHSIQTSTHSLFVDHASVTALIDAMDAATGYAVVPGTTTPQAMPAAIAALLQNYWHSGDKAAPTAPGTPAQMSGIEDVPIASTGNWGVVDHDGNLATYSVKQGAGPAHGTVAITNPATGALTYTPAHNFNGQDSFTLVAKDANNQSVEFIVTVTVDPVADAPEGLREKDGIALSIVEATEASPTANGSTVGWLEGSDPESDTFVWSFAQDGGVILNGNGRFGISEDGRIYVVDASRLDRETGDSYVVRVRAADIGGAWAERDFTIAVADANDPNSLAALAPVTMAENSAAGALVATAHASDIDQSGAFASQRYFFLNGADENVVSSDGHLQIDSVTGEIRLLTQLDYESAPQRSYSVAARDNPGASQSYRAVTTLVLTAADANEANGFDAVGAMTIGEDADEGALVGQVHAHDADTSGPFAQQRYYFGDGPSPSGVSADGRYRIDPETGQIRTNAAIDFEGGSAPAGYRVIAIDNPGGTDHNTAEINVQISVTDVNEPNHLDPLTPFTIAENVAAGAVVGTIEATDDDAGGANATQSYSFLINDAPAQISEDGRFAIDVNTGVITSRVSLNYEATPLLSYSVVARDLGGGANGHHSTTLVEIAVTDVNDPNAFAGSYSFTLQENSTAPAGTVAAFDGDSPNTLNARQAYFFRYADGTEHVSSQDGRFTIGTATGIVTPLAAFNFETVTAPFSYTIVARDREGGTANNMASAGLTITIANVNEAPLAPALTTGFAPIVAENATGWEAVFDLQDPDGPTPGLYFLSNPGNIFTITGGKVTFTGLAAPSFETLYQNHNAVDSDQDGLWEVELIRSLRTVDSAGAFSEWVTGAVKVEDVNEAPTNVLATMIVTQVMERDRVPASTPAAQAIAIATISVVDPDSADFTTGQYSYAVDDGRFEVVDGTLYLKASGKLDFEEGDGIARVKVIATDKTGLPSANVIEKTIEVTILDRDDVLEGDSNPNTFTGQQNRDKIYGFGGDDTIDGGAGNDLLDGGTGKDTLTGGFGVDELLGSFGDDSLWGGADGDTLRGGEDNDVLIGGAGGDTLDGGDGIDWAVYLKSDEAVGATVGVVADLENASANSGSAAGDTYVGIEHVYGTDLADIVRGNSANNRLMGAEGNDTLEGRGGIDTIEGGKGNDTIYGDFQDDPLDGTSTTHVGHGGDTLSGNEGNDTIYGGLGNDTIDGGDDDDTIYAQGHNDTLIGGKGDDILNGGLGSDTYIIDRDSGHDKIFNFNPSGTDTDILGIRNTAGVVTDKNLWFEQVDATSGQSSPTGADLKITILGSGASATVKNWFPGDVNRQYQIDFITTQDTFTKRINVGALVDLMRGRTAPPPATDQAYWDKWQAVWFSNFAPTVTGEAAKTANEDSPAVLDIVVSDDITIESGFTFSHRVTQGADLIGSIAIGPVGAGGHAAFQVTPTANRTGTAVIMLTAYDAGGHPSDERALTVTFVGTPDKPSVGLFSATPGTSGQAAGNAIQLQVAFPDDDGSEVHEIRITGIPAGVSLSAGTYNSAGGYWSLAQNQTQGLKLITPTGWYEDLSLTVRAYATEGGTTAVSDAATTTVVINAPPVGVKINNVATASIAENSGALIGTISGVDNDTGDTLTLTLANAATSPFKLVGNQLFAKTATSLDFEAAASHTVSFIVTDSFNASYTGSVTVTVINVNEVGVMVPSYAMTVAENAANAVVGTVQAYDPDSAGSPFGQQRYGFLNGTDWQVDSSDGRFTIDQVTGQIRTKVALDKETIASFSYVVAARDNAGIGTYNQLTTTVSIAVTDVNEANSLPARTFTVDENKAAVVSVGFAGATDLDSPTSNFGKQLYAFEITPANGSTPAVLDVNTADGRFSIDSLTGEIKTRRSLNKEVDGPTSYTVVARDNLGNSPSLRASATFTFNIGDVNEANSFAGSYDGTIDENSAIGLGTRIKVTGSSNELRVQASDPDSVSTDFGTQKYYFTAGTTSGDGLYSTSADGRFILAVDTGYISVAAALDSEAIGPTVAYNIIARDNAGKANYFEASSSIVIRITNVNEQNTLPAQYLLAIDENVAGGTPVGQVTASDPDSAATAYGQQRYYFKHSDGTYRDYSEDNRFLINLLTGAITTNGSPDFETFGAAARSYLVAARDNAGAAGFKEATTDVRISVNNLAERPNAPTGPDFVDFDEAGVGTNPAAAPRVFASYGLTDPDGPAPGLQFAAGGNLGGWFTISGNSVLFNANFDFEWAVAQGYAQGDHNGDGIADVFLGNVTVQANDGGLTSLATKSTAFYLSNTRERPGAMTLQSETRYSETLPGDVSHAGQVIARFNMSDPDGQTPALIITGGNPYDFFTTSGNALTFNGANFTASWLRDHLGQYGIDTGWYSDWDNDGLKEIKVATLQLQAVDPNGLLSDPFSYSIYIEDKNEAPAFVAGSFVWSLSENPAYYQQVGTVQATDVDGPAGELRYTFSGSNAYVDGALGRWVSASSDGRLVMDLLDGRVWVNGNQALDYETVNSLAYQVQVLDRSGGAYALGATAAIAISVQDVNEAHSLQSGSFTINESNTALGPFIPLPTTAGTVIDLDTLLSDPENRAMHWQFSDGTTSNGTWQIEQDGTLRMVAGVDYDALVATWEEVVVGYDYEGQPVYGMQ